LSLPRKMVSIHEAAEFLGVSAQTLRRWEREGWLR
jgi:DNA-binding transcriptional MerR regulator